MPLQRLATAAGLIAALLINADAFAADISPQASVVCAADALQALFESSLMDNSTAFSLSDSMADLAQLTAAGEAASDTASSQMSSVSAAVPDSRQLLADFALTLRDIRYRRGGRAPATGFDCSGFVHYVFAKTLGVELPDDSASQFRAGMQVARAELKTGDLVFFHIRGKRVSHVGIYLDHGRFIHSPTTGERVRIDELGASYWAKRFAGAKRPDALT